MAHSDFLSVADQYQLGSLETEQPHPATVHLSTLAKSDPAGAIEMLRGVDRQALAALARRTPDLVPLAAAMRRTIDRGRKVFLCGCGATGRLSITLEILARAGLLRGATAGNIVGFMAGGDAAMIRSIERFEDRPDYGARQLRDLGFGDGDLLIASTEGGETPFVIGATEAAAVGSGEKPFFLYCNPDDLLIRHVDRSRRVIENPDVRKINLSVGPMALAGSTRMQASTVLMAAIGFAMKHGDAPSGIAGDFDAWRNRVIEEPDWTSLAPFVEAEAAAYQSNQYVLYEPGEFGLTVLTDTTERSPTFTLAPFERDPGGESPSLCFLWIRGTRDADDALERLLGRKPNPVEWGDLRHLTDRDAIRTFDFSDTGKAKREKRTGGTNQLFSISGIPDGIRLEFQDLEATFPAGEPGDLLGRNLALKLLLNVHSTVVMGRLGRYEDNLMTFVSANNHKLIDRAIRYVRLLLKRHHDKEPSYREVAEELLLLKDSLHPDEPIVLKTIERFL